MRTLLFVAGLLLLLSACNKDDNNIPDPEPENPVYFPVKHGSWWVYEHYKIDSTGAETQLSMRDSLTILRDTVVNGKSYAVLEGSSFFYGGSWNIVNLLRDSADCVINEMGIPLFAYDNYSDILHKDFMLHTGSNDTLYTIIYQMNQAPSTINVPAGDFDVINNNGILITFPTNIPVPNPRLIHKLYSENVGLVLDTYYYLSQPHRFERRLIRYHIPAD